jgi:threonyl-tRNA synthetase
MVHRSVIGSVERAVAQLVEVHGGAFPVWLAPVQLVLLPVGAEQEERAYELVRAAVGAGLRAEVAGPGEGTLGARIRAARLVPYQAVIGPREAAEDLVAVRLRDGRRPGPLPGAELLHRIADRVRARGRALWADA